MSSWTHIRFKAACPRCSAPIHGFKSREGAFMAEVWDVTEMQAECHGCGAMVTGEITAQVVVQQCDVRLTATVAPTPERDRREVADANCWRWMREQGCNASLLGALSGATPERFDEIAHASMRHGVDAVGD